jgi:trans-feruloyl-CoA hydratase/vanillin synthase
VPDYSFDTILVDVEGGVATLTFNRPAKRNAMSPQLHRDVATALERLRYDPAAKVIVLTGAGKAFCAGIASSASQRSGAAARCDTFPNPRSR